MSYSRFGESYWYTFWACAPVDSIENRDSAIFEICPLLSFTAAELRANVDECLERAKLADLEKETTYYRGQATEFDLAELRAMMLEFVADVDAKYSTGDTLDGSRKARP